MVLAHHECLPSAICLFMAFVIFVWILIQRPGVGRFTFKCVSERTVEEMDMKTDLLMYEVTLPVSETPDVVSKRLTVSRGNLVGDLFVANQVVELTGGDDVAMIEAAQDDTVGLSLIVVDNGGNESEPVTAEFVAVDTIKPILVGEMTAKAVGERVVGEDDVVEEPPADPADPEAPEAPADPADPEAPATPE